MGQNNNQGYDNTNKGSLFLNHDKKKLANERDTSKWANAQGKINIYGMEFYLSAWTNVIKKGDRKGERFQSLSVKPVDEADGQKVKQAIESIMSGGSAPAQKGGAKKSSVDLGQDFDDMDDDLPF